jgi:hypothetical protein
MNIRRAGHIESVGETKNVYKILGGKHKGRYYLGYIGVNVRIILKLILEN